MSQPLSPRFLALDVFRGLTVCFMIIVNTPGSWAHIYGPLEHAAWHGFTATDLVFPSFLFAVGNAMAFSMHKYETQGSAAFWKKTLTRAGLIFLIGSLMYWFPFYKVVDGHYMIKPLATLRLLGVLQRIALCYLFGAIIIHYTKPTTTAVVGGLLLLLYWGIMYVFGDYTLTGNAALKVDLAIIGDAHMYHGEGIAFDPEGILSTLSSIVNVLIGYLVGLFIRRHGNTYETIARIMVAGAVIIFAAFCWDIVFPFNKKIWTSSFVLLTCGIDMLILAVLIYTLEIKKITQGSYFFLVFGRNPLFIYLLSNIIIITMSRISVGDTTLSGWIYRDVLCSIASPVFASFLFAICYMLLNWSIGYVLDKRKIYIKV